MKDNKIYIIFHIYDDRAVTISLFNTKRRVKNITIAPPDNISETVWRILPRWFDTQQKKDMLAGVGYRQEKNKGSHSTIRYILSIINTLGVVDGIPIVALSKKQGYNELIKKIHQSRIHYELTAQYTK